LGFPPSCAHAQRHLPSWFLLLNEGTWLQKHVATWQEAASNAHLLWRSLVFHCYFLGQVFVVGYLMIKGIQMPTVGKGLASSVAQFIHQLLLELP